MEGKAEEEVLLIYLLPSAKQRVGVGAELSGDNTPTESDMEEHFEENLHSKQQINIISIRQPMIAKRGGRRVLWMLDGSYSNDPIWRLEIETLPYDRLTAPQGC